MHTTNGLLASLGPLTRIDPNLANRLDTNDIVKMGVAALVFGMVMASARNFIGKANAFAILLIMAWMFYTHSLQHLYLAIGYAALSSFFLLSVTRRAQA